MQRKIKWHRVLLICGGLLLGLGLVYLVALLVTLRQIEIAWRPITYSESARLFRRQDRHIAGQARQQSEERGGLGDV